MVSPSAWNQLPTSEALIVSALLIPPFAQTPSLGEATQQFFIALGNDLAGLGGYALALFLVVVWVAWWLWGVRWERAWPVLAGGAWMPLVLLGVLVALVWSQIAPGSRTFLGFAVVPNFWWQLVAVGSLVGLALFCGWLQGVLGWGPAEVSLQPPAHEHGHHDDHGHAHVEHAQAPAHGHH
jgi:hypothetical protein